jgi:hypothetical protein
MKLQVTESQLKLIEQQQLDELKWLANVQSHIVKMDVPLTPSLVNYIWGKQRVTTFHIGDVMGIDRIGSMVGKRKSLSTFRFMEKTMLSKMKGIQTEGRGAAELAKTDCANEPTPKNKQCHAPNRRVEVVVFGVRN